MDILTVTELSAIIAMKIEAEDQTVVADFNSLIDGLKTQEKISSVETALNTLSILIDDISRNKVDFFNYLKTNVTSTEYIDFDYIDYIRKVLDPVEIDVDALLKENKKFSTNEKTYQYYYYLSMQAIKTKNTDLIQKALDVLHTLN